MNRTPNLKAKYVWFNLEMNSYLCAEGTPKLKFVFSKKYEEALTFSSKEDALDFMNNNAEEVFKLGEDWTTREYFNKI